MSGSSVLYLLYTPSYGIGCQLSTFPSILTKSYCLQKELRYFKSMFFKNDNSDYIYFEQKTIDGTDFIVDNDDGYSQINEITNYEIYFRYANDNYVYVWNNCKYSMFIRSSLELSGSELILIIEGLTVQ